jgi:carboxynorspermidine decarboxylase
METLGDLCDYVALNSLSQWERYRKTLSGKTSVGLRVNPQLSFADDERYDPCREASKLGMPINLLTDVLAKNPSRLDGLKGIHFHTNCDSSTFQPLLETVRLVTQELDSLLKRMEWVNIGGGYLFESESELPYLYEAIALLKSRYNVEVFMEPGAALVRNAGLLVASVIDLFESDDTQIAMLDTSVNHLPEVYEYQYEPDILGDSEEGEYEYLLSGATCLAGDVFGEYGFDEPLEIGSRIVIPKMGAYTLVKAHMFNGVNLPTIYFLTESGELKLRQRFTYQDFLSRLGGHANAGL